MKMKYIKVNIQTVDTLILFSEFVTHELIANKFGGVDRVLSAGFCSIHDESASCYGESKSLTKKSDITVDSKILKRMLTDF